MTDRDALCSAIIANPDEDTPRLVYADWLQEHGQEERAEFIRLQCRLEHATAAEWDALAVREVELRTKLFLHLDALGFAEIAFRRGFVSSITSGVLNFRDSAASLRPEDAPAFALFLREDDRDREMSDDDYEAHDAVFGEVAARPELRQCVELDLPCIGITAMDNLLSSPHLTNLRRLNAPESEAGPAFHALDSPTFANLCWLNISGSNSAGGPADVPYFTENPHLANLEYLDFSSNRMIGDDIHRWDESRHLNSLRVLNASNSEFLDYGVSWVLFCGDGLPALKELDLSRCFGDLIDHSDAVNELDEDRGRPSHPIITRLSKLRLRDNRITDTGARALAEYPRHLSLSLLDLSGNLISDDGRRILQERFGKDVCVFEGTDR
jgi:uncharacterized protein (TIGR02996 family)